jgi:glycosyltransferase involved in cell wall biosynthesis
MAASDELPALSVVLPVYNAMPWLPITVRDMLKQQLAGAASLELLAAFDGGDDGSLGFLEELVALLGDKRASVEMCQPPGGVEPLPEPSPKRPRVDAEPGPPPPAAAVSMG